MKEDGTVDVASSLSSVQAKEYRWTDVRVASGAIAGDLDKGAGFAFIFSRSKIIGVAVSNKLVFEHGKSGIQRISYSTTDIGQKTPEAAENLNSGRAIVITRFNATQFTIYPAASVPQGIASHILGKPLLGNSLETADQETDLSQITAGVEEQRGEVSHDQTALPEHLKTDFVVASGQPMTIPTDLAQRISIRRVEEEILRRVEDVRKRLEDKDVVTGILWNKTELRLMSNPILVKNTTGLAEHFVLQVQTIEGANDGLVSWVSAFEKAASYDGLIVFKPAGQPDVLMTRKPDFFANLAREFCQ